MRVGFLSSSNYFSKDAFSGILYSMHAALRRRGIEVVDLGWPIRPGLRAKIRRRLRRGLSLDLTRPTFPTERSRFAQQVRRQLTKTPCDVLFAPVGSAEIDAVTGPEPVVYNSDATFELLSAHYDLNLTDAQRSECDRLEQAAISRARHIVYSSTWAADSAVKRYGAHPERVSVIQFGANMEVVPPGESVLGRCDDRKCRLLFVGRDFKRKGGSYALEALEALRRRGVDAHLVILGSVPPTAPSSNEVEVIPYLDKNNPADVRRIYDLYMGSHYLLFPTRADCSPIALCEAAAFGLPVVSSQVGGIASIVSEGENGFLLPLDADANAYADRIESSFADRERYRQLVLSSRSRYDALLNWDRWAERLEPVLRQAAST